MMERIVPVLLWAAVIAAVVYRFFIKKGQNRKAAQSGEDMAKVKEAVGKVLPEAERYKLAYAHWEEQESYGRAVRTTYYRYAVAFQGQGLLVFPLSIDKKTRQIQAGRPAVLGPESLGKVKVKTKEKDGAPSEIGVWLGDKQGHVITQVTVSAENLRKSRWYPVNIVQQEECEAFERFITSLARQVAGENPGVDALMAAESNEGLGGLGAMLSGIGVLLGIFFPPGGILAPIGLIMAIVSKRRGAKGYKSLIVSAICTVICVAWMMFFLSVYR